MLRGAGFYTTHFHISGFSQKIFRFLGLKKYDPLILEISCASIEKFQWLRFEDSYYV